MSPARMYVDTWDPSYGPSLDPAEGGPTGESSAQIRADVETPAAAWQPISPPAGLTPPAVVLLVDGVRRVDARIWVEDSDGTVHAGLAASYAAGVVRCDLRAGQAVVVAAQVARGLFTPSAEAGALAATATSYPVHRVDGSDPAQLTAAVQPLLHALEEDVSRQARATAGHPSDPARPAIPSDEADDLLVIDGPLRGRTHLPRALGFVKTHRVSYLPPELSAVVGELRPGQRCPVFRLGTNWERYTWYLKLPGPAGSPWAGVVRVEAPIELSASAVVALADRSAITLPPFASSAYKDSRAPQNLIPIAGLERRLRSMLGDPRLLLRSLTTAAAELRGAATAAVPLEAA